MRSVRRNDDNLVEVLDTRLENLCHIGSRRDIFCSGHRLDTICAIEKGISISK